MFNWTVGAQGRFNALANPFRLMVQTCRPACLRRAATV
ncbi:hypothetical protein J2T15_000756 [Paenibacillus harenae]|uniref:Uncharacterized protein n=1 Tax=Paenibacillus harenae TaxID=306543 RepID=A0ABT9TX57_PAEHA|nr:hypothetical protein [Paenibacillus harenae]MDQ0111323.1 hypothetical protein [Paenibacillus harenae]